MVRQVMSFQEQVLCITDIIELQDATIIMMDSLGLPHFIYVWGAIDDFFKKCLMKESFFSTVSSAYLSQYIDNKMYQHDPSIQASCGLSSTPYLAGRSMFHWKNVPFGELNFFEKQFWRFQKEHLNDGFTARIDKNDESFSCVSLVCENTTLDAFERSLDNATIALQVMRIYHDRYHELYQQRSKVITDYSDLQAIAEAMDTEKSTAARALLSKVMSRASPAPNALEHRALQHPKPLFHHTPRYDRVYFGGEFFNFGPAQAIVIKMLHKASEANDPWIPENQLLSATRGKSKNVRDLFRRHNVDLLFEKNDRHEVRLKLY